MDINDRGETGDLDTPAEHGPEDRVYKDYFSLFARISKQIHANTETKEILNCIVENITDILGARGAIYWILNPGEKRIETRIFKGFDYRSLSRVDYATITTLFARTNDSPITIDDARNDPRIPDLERLGKRLIQSVTGIYFDINGPCTGLLAVYFSAKKQLKDHELTLLTALGEQGAIALEKALGYDKKMLAMYRQIVEGFALAIEARDKVTHGHSLTVARLAKLTALHMGLDEKQALTIHQAGLLHDIGKIGAKDDILDRLGRLKAGEMAAIREHPATGADILSPLPFFSDIAPLVRHHHELYNGTGYPDQKKGDDIPLGARIITVCDAFETMVTGRPKIPRKNLAEALSSLENGSGTRFDPDVVQAFFAMAEKNPETLESRESIEDRLKILKENMARTARENQIGVKLPNPFPSTF